MSAHQCPSWPITTSDPFLLSGVLLPTPTSKRDRVLVVDLVDGVEDGVGEDDV